MLQEILMTKVSQAANAIWKKINLLQNEIVSNITNLYATITFTARDGHEWRACFYD